MKLRSGKATTLVIEPVSLPPPPHESSPDAEDFLRDPDDVSPDLPEDKTPIAVPSGMTLQHAGGRPYQQLRPVLLGFGGVLVVVIAFLSGAAFSARRSAPEPAPVEVAPPVTPELVEPLAPLAPSVQALAPEPDPEPQPEAEVELPPDLAPIPVPATVPDTILLAVTVSPPDAEVRIDGQAMPSNPFVARFPRSADTHRIRVTAPGYQSKERLVSFGDNVTLDLSLTPAAVAPPVARERPARRPPPAARRASPPPPLRESRSSPVAATPQPAPGPTIELLPRPLENDPARRRRIEARDPYADDSP
jgi:hypothetical protein